MCLLVELGLPDYFVLVQGSAYTFTEMTGLVEAFETCLDETPIETPGATVVVEWYHTPLR